jgi:hypothetical protein
VDLSQTTLKPDVSGVTTAYAMTTVYDWDMGIAQQPLSGPAGNAADFVQLYAPTCRKLVYWVAQRIGSKPVLPSPSPADPNNEVLLHKQISPAMPGSMPDGSQVWTIAGVYTYGLAVPPEEDDPLSAGVSPLDQRTTADNLILASDFVKALLAPVPPVTGEPAVPPIDPINPIQKYIG